MEATLTRKPSREDLRPGEVLCDHCTAKCCRYFALPIEEPKTRRDFDFIRWYLLHDRATVFTEDDTWYILVHTVCRHLQPDQRCGIYETRPEICREYTTESCEYDDDWVYDRYFETPEQVEEYAEAVLPRKRGSIRGRKPPLLPMV
jgi:Fe-S-cluster containining protein